jgi:deferrochelatase/peroxidase EfeB
MLSDTLKGPISWKSHDPEITKFLDDLQGNILKYHGRNNVVFMFCRFRDDTKSEARSFLRNQVARVQSAKEQLLLAEHKRSTKIKSDKPFVSIFLTKPGYDYFGIVQNKQPPDPAFQAGMAAAALNDPPKQNWASHIRDPHIMVLVAVGGRDEAQRESTRLLNEIGQIGEVEAGHSGELIGNQFFNQAGNGIENFGYVDGRSQPLVLTEDFPGEIANGGMDKWPLTPFPVNQFVVRDPAVDDPTAYGSYFVFRQLEQDVRGFKTREDEIVKGHEPDFENRDSAGVGRLESGTPFELRDKDPKDPTGKTDLPDITNNFTFITNPPNCPHFAHIRKVNPRTAATQGNLMIRRGMTYGIRKDASFDPNDASKLVLEDEVESEDLPSGGVGLLFQSYQADIRNQFETTQGWANSIRDGGLDPVIGQAPAAIEDWPLVYGGVGPGKTEKLDFYKRTNGGGDGPYVKLLGGGYFFAPSLPFLKSL